MRWWFRARHIWVLVVSATLVLALAWIFPDLRFGFPSLRSGQPVVIPFDHVSPLLPAVVSITLLDLTHWNLELVAQRRWALGWLDLGAVWLGPALLTPALAQTPEAARNAVVFTGLGLIGLTCLPRGFAFLAPVLPTLIMMAFGNGFGQATPDPWAVVLAPIDPGRDVVLCAALFVLGSLLFLRSRQGLPTRK